MYFPGGAFAPQGYYYSYGGTAHQPGEAPIGSDQATEDCGEAHQQTDSLAGPPLASNHLYQPGFVYQAQPLYSPLPPSTATGEHRPPDGRPMAPIPLQVLSSTNYRMPDPSQFFPPGTPFPWADPHAQNGTPPRAPPGAPQGNPKLPAPPDNVAMANIAQAQATAALAAQQAQLIQHLQHHHFLAGGRFLPFPRGPFLGVGFRGPRGVWNTPRGGRGRGLYPDGRYETGNERGPRAVRARSLRGGSSEQGGDGPEEPECPIDRSLYNRPEFDARPTAARFFVIKSYSEDDVHKSIKYSLWASTPNGNRRLDVAFREAQNRPPACPLFLFFSVNASGQFCGVAEMVGGVDFETSAEYWQQDKWSGQFPVQWHLIKDVPNSHFRHIILENNDNKPVTNSRDTQEVHYEQGIEMLALFKSFSAKTSILDDFGFYDTRQKALLERKARGPGKNKKKLTGGQQPAASLTETSSESTSLVEGLSRSSSEGVRQENLDSNEGKS